VSEIDLPVNLTVDLVSIFTKGQEFHTWLVEERKINPETITKDANKKEFARFMEDYNTGKFALSSRPYYSTKPTGQPLYQMKSTTIWSRTTAGWLLSGKESSYPRRMTRMIHRRI
jgi:hypothetical protein